MVGKEVTAIVLEALNSGEFPSSIHHTFISLIPKNKKPELVVDFRPISLCNAFYKLI